MANKPIVRPQAMQNTDGRIGYPAVGLTAEKIRGNSDYLRHQLGMGQVFTYAGPGSPKAGWHSSPDYDYHDIWGQYPEFAVILHSPPKKDTSNPDRQLAGVIIPWRVVPGRDPVEYVDKPAFVTWKHLQGGSTIEHLLWRSERENPDGPHTASYQTYIEQPDPIHLYDHRSHTLFADFSCEYHVSYLYDHWGWGNAATLSKDTSYYRTGSQSLKVACSGTANPYAIGPVLRQEYQLTVGCDYEFAIYAKGDGNAYPRIICGGDTLATGTTSTDWQLLTGTFTADDEYLDLMAVTSTTSQYCNFDQVFVHELGKFRYTPDGDGEFTVGFLKYDRMRVASLSVFAAPDRTLTDDQLVVRSRDVAPGRAIRGYTGTGVGSLGDLEYMTGAGGSDYDVDDCERMTRRCLLGTGHPRGWKTSEESWYNIRGGRDSYFKITPRNILGQAAGNDVTTIPMAYGQCYGASPGTPGQIRYTSVTSGDTWTYSIESDSAALWGDMATLDVDAAGDLVKIEVQAPEDGWLNLRSFSLWEDTYS